MSRIVVVGASIAGLSTGLLLARAGHEVVVLDGDDVSPGDPDDVIARAFRPGAPQAVHAHAFLARGRAVLRDRLPDVLDKLRGEGVTDLPLPPPPSLAGQVIQRDPDLIFLMVRRPLAEWALRAVAATQPYLEVRTGERVTGLVLDESGAVPRVTGVTLRSGGVQTADLVIDASGRRSSIVRGLSQSVAMAPVVQSEDCGMVYFSRAYRVRSGISTLPPLNRGFAAGALLPRFGTLLAPCENGHVVVAITPLASDVAMKSVHTSTVFDAVLRKVGPISPWLDVLEPTSDVYSMGGLQSTLNRVVRNETAVVHGLHLVGDACSTTNPTYGRGLSWALAHAGVLTDVIAQYPDDLDRQAKALDAWIAAEIAPFYEDAVAGDRVRVSMMNRALLGQDPVSAISSPPSQLNGDPGRPTFMQLVSASLADAYVWQRLARYQSLLATPNELYDDPKLRERIAQINSAPIPFPVPTGPTNEELAAILN